MTEFRKWCLENGLDENHIEIARDAWNAGIDAACDMFGELEGTDHGVSSELQDYE